MQRIIANRRAEVRMWWSVALCVLLAGVAVSPAAPATNRYVVKDNPGAAPPYDSPANAAGDIQTAISAAVAANGDQVIVAAGVYDTGGVEVPTYEGITNRVAVTNAIIVRSLDNDPATTIIEGAWDPATNGPAAVRGVFLGSGATLTGFTVRNGATSPVGNNRNQRGGGVFCPGAAVISNCVISGNAAMFYGGGVHQGTILDSVIVSNRADNNGGGVYWSTLNRCTVSHNRSDSYGGGGRTVTAMNSVFSYNEAVIGGGLVDGTLYNCLLYGNLSDGPFGGQGGGAIWGTFSLYNCTIVGNRDTWVGGGGLYVRTTATLYNTIVYSNDAREVVGPNIYVKDGATLYITNSCTYPAITGWADGNITNDPLFKAYGSGFGTNHVAGDYHPTLASLCVNAGTNQPWMEDAVDLDGGVRIRDDRVDMGCYEPFFARGTAIFIR